MMERNLPWVSLIHSRLFLTCGKDWTEPGMIGKRTFLGSTRPTESGDRTIRTIFLKAFGEPKLLHSRHWMLDQPHKISSGRFSSVMISHYTEFLIQKALDLANVSDCFTAAKFHQHLIFSPGLL